MVVELVTASVHIGTVRRDTQRMRTNSVAEQGGWQDRHASGRRRDDGRYRRMAARLVEDGWKCGVKGDGGRQRLHKAGAMWAAQAMGETGDGSVTTKTDGMRVRDVSATSGTPMRCLRNQRLTSL